MIEVFARHKNVGRFLAGVESVETPINGRIGMGLFFGDPGTGKSEIGVRYAAERNWPYVRATRNMSLGGHRQVLSAIVAALGESPMYRSADMFDQILDNLIERPRVLIIDEADYLIKGGLVEILRDINDLTNSPVVIMGMANIDGALSRFRHLYDRFTVIVKFQLLDEEDVRSIAAELCPIPLADGAIAHIVQQSHGKLRLITTILARAARMAKTNRLDRLELAHVAKINIGGM